MLIVTDNIFLSAGRGCSMVPGWISQYVLHRLIATLYVPTEVKSLANWNE
jgi:hypothetical protein